MLDRDAIFTNVGVTADNQPWWEGKDGGEPARDWQGNEWQPDGGPAAHPNSRFTVSIKNCPTYSEQAEAPMGVPISAIVLGGRRERLVPLVMEARSWRHGVLLGASMASETTAAATGAVGVVRRDPMAMKPFCGYNFGDYWQHWLNIGETLSNPPGVFHVNWFRKDREGNFMWPGFGENLRVLEWVIERCRGAADARDTAVGRLPRDGGINTAGLEITPDAMAALLQVDSEGWRRETEEIGDYLRSYGERLPRDLLEELLEVERALDT